MNTSNQQHSRHVSVPQNQGVRVDKAITINKPIGEVYAFWRRLDNLPRFMRHLQSVTVQDDMHSHWAVKAIAGKVLEWDAEIIEQRDNEMISWRSAPGADVDNAGSVWFTSVPGGEGTMVRVELKYVPPAGKAGAGFAKLLGADADAAITEDLGRLKSLLETGQVPPEPAASGLRRAAGVARKAAQSTDTCVRDNPWSAIAVVGLAVFALGFLLGSRVSSPQIPQPSERPRRSRLPSNLNQLRRKWSNMRTRAGH
jgi:uncharacterized membrane protein